MSKQAKVSIEFDYTNFLGTTSSKKWTFMEALATIAPVFSIAWKNNLQELTSPEDRLWEAALKSLSTRKSDEQNIIMLAKLAKQEGIQHLLVSMPYSLDSKQLGTIAEKTSSSLESKDDDVLSITF